MKRWLALAVALVLVGGAAWLWLRDPGRTTPDTSTSKPEIDDASRAALDRVLREADREGAKRP
jgi:hypothetical protein